MPEEIGNELRMSTMEIAEITGWSVSSAFMSVVRKKRALEKFGPLIQKQGAKGLKYKVFYLNMAQACHVADQDTIDDIIESFWTAEKTFCAQRQFIRARRLPHGMCEIIGVIPDQEYTFLLRRLYP